jgi:hypothetical protein
MTFVINKNNIGGERKESGSLCVSVNFCIPALD